MNVDAYDLSDDVTLPLRVASALRAESWLLAFFGAEGIRVHDDAEVSVWTPAPPYLAIIPDPIRETRAAGEVLQATIRMRIRAYLQTMIPTAPWLTPPGAPVVTVDGAGPLTGSRLYAATVYDPRGESCVADSTGIVMTSSPVTYAAQKGAVVMPTVATGLALRLWATKLGGTALYFHSLAASGATVADTKTDNELSLEMAPVRFLGLRIVSACKRSLIGVDGFDGKAFRAITFENDTVRAENGVRVHEFQALVPSRFSVYTRESTV